MLYPRLKYPDLAVRETLIWTGYVFYGKGAKSPNPLPLGLGQLLYLYSFGIICNYLYDYFRFRLNLFSSHRLRRGNR